MSTQNTISVISICFNNLQELEQTIASVVIQKQQPFEHIIIDGSNNGEIKKYLQNNQLSNFCKWISEPDNGIYDAINKGVNKATGNIVVILNSGDTFFGENAITMATVAFENNKNLQWLHSKYKLQRGNRWVIIGKPFEYAKLYRGMRSICHQTMFVKKQLHQKHGLYNTKLKIAADYDFLCKIAKEEFAFLQTPLICFAPAGISSNQYKLSLIETKQVFQSHFKKSLKLHLWQLRLKFLHFLLQSPLGNFLYKIKTKLKLENA